MKEILYKMTAQEKIDAMNVCGINEIHDSISFKDGTLTCTLQIGHPNEPGSISGCFNTHLAEAFIRLQLYYQKQLPSLENELSIKLLRELKKTFEKRASRRKMAGILNTDKEE